MKGYVIFLHGVYRRRDLPFYVGLCRSRKTIAVDGGYSFFRKSGLVADVLMGDFDSLKKRPARLPKETTVLSFPTRKDYSDSHLGVQYCLDHGATYVDIVQPSFGDVDHFLGNVMLMAHPDVGERRRRPLRVRLVSAGYELRLVYNGATTFTDCVGDIVSMIPLSSEVRLTCRGTEYRARQLRLRMGESRALRNRITARRATFRIVGKALVAHQFGDRS